MGKLLSKRETIQRLDQVILRLQRKKIDRMYNRACDLRDAYPNHLIGADEYEYFDTMYGQQYRRAWKYGHVLAFRAQTRTFRKRFTVQRKP